ncbi:MAG: EcoRV family type II restriction endonuclease [Bacteroidales bacterium]|nr:EcoRV family type II restriction endonuclease [Bacteroidales bacterium]
MEIKEDFKKKQKEFAKLIMSNISDDRGQWTIKGFIDIYKNIYTLSSDTKIISKILEIHLFHRILAFAESNNYNIVLAEHQNYYPDITFVSRKNNKIKFAVDFKTTYRKPDNQKFCNGFTLGSHGEYFINRTSKKNIQFPYKEYKGHFCLGIIYDRTEDSSIDETKTYNLNQLQSIASVVRNFSVFIAEKWKIASDKGGSGNTANIGSINYIDDIINEKGMFSKLGEDWFDDYWMNYGKITIKDKNGKLKKLTNLPDFIKYRKGDPSLIIAKRSSKDEN